MSKNIFANGKEISAKKDDNKSICAMPDVCLSPPSPPAGPVPIPYPNTAKSSDTNDGSKSVKFGGSEVGLKNSSSYKKSMGDEAATKSLGMGVVTHTIQGKMKHAAWSFDVKIEGKNVIRHMDITTHNHINQQNSGDMTLNQAAQEYAQIGELTCDDLEDLNREARTNEVDPDADLGKTTTTTAYRRDGQGNGRYLKAMTPNAPHPEHADGYQPPISDPRQPPCAGGRSTDCQRRNDAENKILFPEMDAQGGGSILLSTMHPSPGGEGVDAAPCNSCRQAICEAEECGIKVYLCRSSGRPPDAVRPAKAGLCDDPGGGHGSYNPDWQNMGLGNWPP